MDELKTEVQEMWLNGSLYFYIWKYTNIAYSAISSEEVSAVVSLLSSNSGMSLKHPQGILMQFEFKKCSPKCILDRNINYCMTQKSGWIKTCLRPVTGGQDVL
jgi:hypothetical protein